MDIRDAAHGIDRQYEEAIIEGTFSGSYAEYEKKWFSYACGNKAPITKKQHTL